MSASMKLLFEKYEKATKQKGYEACSDFGLSSANYSRIKNRVSRDIEFLAVIAEKLPPEKFVELIIAQNGLDKLTAGKE